MTASNEANITVCAATRVLGCHDIVFSSVTTVVITNLDAFPEGNSFFHGTVCVKPKTVFIGNASIYPPPYARVECCSFDNNTFFFSISNQYYYRDLLL